MIRIIDFCQEKEAAMSNENLTEIEKRNLKLVDE